MAGPVEPLDVRRWRGMPIHRKADSFACEDSVRAGFVCANSVCAAAGKEWEHYSTDARTVLFLKALVASMACEAKELVVSGGVAGDSPWVHPRVAVDLARWCSPEFGVWMENWFLDTSLELQRSARKSRSFLPWARSEPLRRVGVPVGEGAGATGATGATKALITSTGETDAHRRSLSGVELADIRGETLHGTLELYFEVEHRVRSEPRQSH